MVYCFQILNVWKNLNLNIHHNFTILLSSHFQGVRSNFHFIQRSLNLQRLSSNVLIRIRPIRFENNSFIKTNISPAAQWFPKQHSPKTCAEFAFHENLFTQDKHFKITFHSVYNKTTTAKNHFHGHYNNFLSKY